MTRHCWAWIRLLLVVSGVLTAAGCDGASSFSPLEVATTYAVFPDCSASVGPDQAARWRAVADQLVFQKLRPADSVVVFCVSDRTADAAPLFDARIPTLSEDAGADEELTVRRALRTAREAGLAAVQLALESSVRSRETRLLESIGRIPRDASRRTFVLYLTDALESSPLLDLERVQVTDANAASLVQGVAGRNRWNKGMLAGVTVQFVLDSPGINRPRPVNDHAALERFWRLVFTLLGADLKFDSRAIL